MAIFNSHFDITRGYCLESSPAVAVKMSVSYVFGLTSMVPDMVKPSTSWLFQRKTCQLESYRKNIPDRSTEGYNKNILKTTKKFHLSPILSTFTAFVAGIVTEESARNLLGSAGPSLPSGPRSPAPDTFLTPITSNSPTLPPSC